MVNRFILIFVSVPAVLFASWDAPWKNPRESVAPWKDESRKANREGFFAKLNRGEFWTDTTREDDSRAERVEISAPKVEENYDRPESDAAIDTIPWAAHSTMYPHEKFSKSLLWPVDGGRLASGYGIRAGHFHEGLDIAAPEGSSISAVADGRVVYSGSLGTYGRVLVLYHGDGMSSIYAHNSVNLRPKGSRVKRGESIALVGQTGRAEGPHCHFELRQNGKPTNPLAYVFSRGRRSPVKDS